MKTLLLIAALLQDADIKLKNGDKQTGKIDKLTIETRSIGKIDINGKDIYAILLTKHRPLSEEKVKKKVEELVTKLGDSDPDVREKSTEELKNMGAEALPLIEKYKEHQDAEVRTRIQSIINVLKDIKTRLYDTVIGNGLILSGIITNLVVDKKELDLTNIKSIRLSKKHISKDTGHVFTLSDGSKIKGKFKSDSIKLKEKDETIDIKTKEIEKIDFKQRLVTVYFRTEFQGDIVGSLEIDSMLGVLNLKHINVTRFDQESSLSYQYLEGTWKGKVNIVDWDGNKRENEIIILFTTVGDKINADLKSSDGSTGSFVGTLEGSWLSGVLIMQNEHWGLSGTLEKNKLECTAKRTSGFSQLELEFKLEQPED